MAAYFFVNAMQVDFESVLSMEHTEMAPMFKTLEDTEHKGLVASGSVYESVVVEFFSNAKVIAGKIITKKKKEKVKKVVEQQPVESGSQTAPTKSKSGTSSDEDSYTLNRLKKLGAKRKQVIESSDSKATVSVPSVLITKKHRTKRKNKVLTTAEHQAESQSGPIPEIPAGGDKESIAGGPEATMETIPQQISLPTPQIMDTTAKELTTLQDLVFSLDLKVERMRDDTNLTRNHTTQLRRQLKNAVNGLQIKIDVLESTLVRKLADNQQNFAALETGLVHHFADSKQNILDEVASLKSQVAEMVECLKELCDAKKGEGPSSKKIQGTSSSKKRRWF
ncbi:hypothetical protein F511_16763 [Dorcoceras hygrometricum]|uniref:Uncharacterized protein n=1 Tax=Dorcoceras hygrometricum TaxID=472368 RepID=A0A2Z7BV54_9LAMI|nr:hypothetical protein F511_16763 [Dorcoceras hygrometricum]